MKSSARAPPKTLAQVDEKRSSGFNGSSARRAPLGSSAGTARDDEATREASTRRSARQADATETEVTEPDESKQDLSILLAEDNPVNQEVALLMLHRLGHRADVASNGLEVLEALSRRKYDVILMDVQMPIMDGLQAARQVRQRYRGQTHPRIIAITAHADRAHCLEAGMDDYLTKPIHKEALATALSIAADPQHGHTLGGMTETESIDRNRLDLFFESSTEDLSTLREAIDADDWPTVREAAHSLLGSSSDLGLTAVSDICLEIKQMPTESPPEELRDAVDRMEHHLHRARKALERMRSLS